MSSPSGLPSPGIWCDFESNVTCDSYTPCTSFYVRLSCDGLTDDQVNRTHDAKQGHGVINKGRTLLVLAASAATLVLSASPAAAYTTADGWTASDYSTGYPAYPNGDVGPIGLAFDRDANLFVTDAAAGAIYKIPPGGGSASDHKLRDGLGMVTGLAFGLDGNLYMARRAEGDVVQVSQADGRILRTVVDGLTCPTGLATDPISGDLFVSNNYCAGGRIMRIQNGTATAYTTEDADGIAFAPDGTLYASAGARVLRFDGTNTSTPGRGTPIANVPHGDGIAYAPATADRPAFLVVARTDGEIDKVGLDGSVTPIITGASRADLVTVGPDGIMYVGLRDRVIKLGPTADSGGVLGYVFSPPATPRSFKADMRIKVTAPKKVKRGGAFNLRLKIRNAGPARATDVFVVDKLPRGLRFSRIVTTEGLQCSRKGRIIGCFTKSMKAGKVHRVRVVARSMRGRIYTNKASVDANQQDPRPKNNLGSSKTKRVGA